MYIEERVCVLVYESEQNRQTTPTNGYADNNATLRRTESQEITSDGESAGRLRQNMPSFSSAAVLSRFPTNRKAFSASIIRDLAITYPIEQSAQHLSVGRGAFAGGTEPSINRDVLPGHRHKLLGRPPARRQIGFMNNSPSAVRH